MLQQLICREADLPVGHTVIDSLRDEAENYVERHSQEIGGFDDNRKQINQSINALLHSWPERN